MIFAKLPTRLTIAFMLFTGCLVNYSMRVNLSVNIVTMVPVSSNASTTNETETETLGWSAYERGLVLSSYFYGYMVANLCGSYFIEQVGPRLMLLFIFFMNGVLTLASPCAAKSSYLALVVLRMAQGLCSGATFPSLHDLIAHWAVSFEKSKFLAAAEMGLIGAVVAWSLCGVIIEAYGWEWAFYSFGIASLVYCVPWWFLVHDGPETHPRISNKEKDFIVNGTIGVENVKRKIPYAKILTSIPVWANIIGSFGSGWLSYLVLLSAPMFVANILQHDVTATGFLSSAVYLVKPFCTLLFGVVGDFIVKRNLMTLCKLRKSFVLVSHFIPGSLLVALSFTEDSVTALVLFALFNSLNAAMVITTSINGLDIGPNFVSTLAGLSLTGYTAAGILSPMVVAYFTQEDEGNFGSWQPIFFTGAAVCFITGIIFLVFASTEIQPWNEIINDVNNEPEPGNNEMQMKKSVKCESGSHKKGSVPPHNTVREP